MLKLYHYDRSPFGWKVRMALAEKRLPYEAILPPDNKSESAEFAKLNPFRLTPVLVLEDGRTVYESSIINEYLEEAHPTPALLPKDPYERARVRALEDAGDQYLYAAVGGLRKALYEYAPPYIIPKSPAEIDEKQVAEARARLHELLPIFEHALDGRTWFGGGEFSLADICVVPALTASLPLLGVLPDKRYPNLAAWAARVKERPSYAESQPKQPLSIKK